MLLKSVSICYLRLKRIENLSLQKGVSARMNHCDKCGNADNFDWEEIQKGKPWLVKCLDCGHSWTEVEN